MIVKNINITKPEISWPDIDTDVGQHPLTGLNKDYVIEYLIDKYGKEYVANVGNRLEYSAKSAIRDLGQVYQIPAAQTFKCTKEYNDELNVETNMKRSKAVKEYFGKYPELIDKVDRLVGTISSFGVHAGGVIIAGKKWPLKRWCALQRTKEEGRVATLWTKDEVAKIGLIKYDILGLSAAGIIHYAKEMVGLNPYEDVPEKEEVFKNIVFNLKHKMIFQFESNLGRKAFADFMPMSINEIANASSIIRLLGTGPGREIYQSYKENIESIQTGDTKRWQRKLKDECYEENIYNAAVKVFKDSYGVLIYQEQLANFVVEISNGEKTFTDGNQLRKKLEKFSKKVGQIDDFQGNPEMLRKWHKQFMEIIGEYILPYLGKDGLKSPDKETQAFLNCKINNEGHLITPKIGPIKWIISSAAYLFSKLHAIAYSVNTYNMMYLKHFYPLEFWTSALICEYNDLNKIREISTAILTENPEIKFVAPNINNSDYNFKMDKNNNTIYYGLGAILGLGKSAKEIIEERNKNGYYESIKEFAYRTSPRIVNKGVIEKLIYINAFSEFNNIDKVWKAMIKYKRLNESIPNLEVGFLSKTEAKLLGCNLTYQDPILKKAAFYISIGEIEDKTSEAVAIKIIKKFNKVTKTGKPYCMYKVQDLNSNETTNLFDWQNRNLENDICMIARVTKNGDFYMLNGPSQTNYSSNADKQKLKKTLKKALVR